MFLSTLKAASRGLAYLFAPVLAFPLALAMAAAVAGKGSFAFLKDYVEYVRNEWPQDVHKHFCAPLAAFYFAQVAPRLIGLLAVLVSPVFFLAVLLCGFRPDGFRKFLEDAKEDLKDFYGAVVHGRAL